MEGRKNVKGKLDMACRIGPQEVRTKYSVEARSQTRLLFSGLKKSLGPCSKD